MNTDFEQIVIVIVTSIIVYFTLIQDPSVAIQIVTTFVSFFISIIIYERLLKGQRGAVSILGHGEIARVAIVFVIFWVAVLISSYGSTIISTYILGFLPGNTPNPFQEFGISLLFTFLTYIGMRLMYYSNRFWNKATLGLITLTIAFFAIMYYFNWNLPLG